MKGMILAAGLGTRLRPLTESRPKAAVPVATLPAAAWSARLMAAASVRDVVVNLHWLGEMVERALGDGTQHGIRITYSQEPDEILGTGGGIRKAARLVGADALIVANGDVISDIDLTALVDAHHEREATATLALVERPEHAAYGTVTLTPGGRIASIAGRRSADLPVPADGEIPAVFTGVHVMGPEALGALPERGCVVRDTYFGMLDRGEPIHGYLHTGYWNDIGTPAAYLSANLDILRGRAGSLAAPFAPQGRRLVHPDARIEPGAVIGDDVIIGAGAEVAADARLVSCVVWDGAKVSGRHTRVVISRDRVVQV
jgi:NDP-sugar pyrophosphorylase family protein